MKARLTSLLLLPILLGGCLLPQPDTPPVGPFGQSAPASAKRPSVGTGTPLLPQPDTPPVGAAPAVGKTEGAVAAGAATSADASSNNGAGLMPNTGAAISAPAAAASSAPTAAPSPLATGKLQGKVTGVTVASILVTDETGSTSFQSAPVGTDGSFSFGLAPGRYLLVLNTGTDQQLKPSQVFTVSAGETRKYTINVKDATEATVSEDAPLASSSPKPTP
ncbi:MAG: hypothetical protein JWM80_772 [Cyanobacteria bacterium RYN_339]|nr:hypothetical protein [Cyanobacteria bacterium RYN_339]